MNYYNDYNDVYDSINNAANSYDKIQRTAELAGTFLVVALIIALVGTILAFIFITPEKKREKLPKFFQICADIFNFKGLIIEKILKFFYVLYTLFLILYGFLMIFAGTNFFLCLAVMILGPIIIRIIFELVMLTVLLVKNVIAINNKLKNQNDAPAQKSAFDFDYTAQFHAPAAPAAPVQEQPKAAYCLNCGTPVSGDSAFCLNCGAPLNK